MDPIVTVDISYAPVQRVGCQHENEVGRLSNAYQKIFVEPANPKTLNVDVDAEAVKSEIDFQQTAARYSANSKTQTLRPLNINVKWPDNLQ